MPEINSFVGMVRSMFRFAKRSRRALGHAVILIALIDPVAATEYHAGVDIAFVRPADPLRFLDVLRATQPASLEKEATDLTHHDSLGHLNIVLKPLARRVVRNGQGFHLSMIEFNLLTSYCSRTYLRIQTVRELIRLRRLLATWMSWFTPPSMWWMT